MVEPGEDLEGMVLEGGGEFVEVRVYPGPLLMHATNKTSAMI